MILIAQRPPTKHLPLKWEFPGGKVELNETPAIAIVREIREELSCGIAIIRALPSFHHAYDAVLIEMIPFVCRLTAASAEPHANEHAALAWVTLAEISAYDLAAADLPIVEELRSR